MTRPAARPGPGACRPCVDCGDTVTLELTGTWRAPHYAPCRVTGDTRHLVADVCRADSGSATGCRPVCDARPDVIVTHTGYRGPYRVPLCDRHADLLPGRIWPDTVTSTAPA